jgi:hypothetical protein
VRGARRSNESLKRMPQLHPPTPPHPNPLPTPPSPLHRYFFTGDGCRRDADGYYWITGRVRAWVKLGRGSTEGVGPVGA